jgi:hypothetical protein
MVAAAMTQAQGYTANGLQQAMQLSASEDTQHVLPFRPVFCTVVLQPREQHIFLLTLLCSI